MDGNQIATLVVTVAITAFVTGIVSAFVTWLVNRPKKRKEEAEAEKKDRAAMKAELAGIKDELKSIGSRVEQFGELQEQNTKEIKLCQMGIQAEIKNTLKVNYESWIKKGYAPIDAKDDLERMYTVYHQLGANGVMDSIRDKFLALPETKPTKKKN